MAILKKTWQEQIQTNNFAEIINENVLTQGAEMDSIMLAKFGIVTNISELLSYIKDYYLTNNELCVWKDMPIYLSSYKEKDKRVVFGLKDRLIKYIKFYNKMITEDGLAREMSIDRGFNNVSADSDTNKNYFSETPQEELDNFENAIIKYASNLTKDERSRRANQNGTSYERAKNLTWDEGMKNLRLVFYNDLVEFITSIPNTLYTYYCLDSRPYPALVKEYYKTVFDAFDLENER